MARLRRAEHRAGTAEHESPALGDASGLSCCLRALARLSLSIGMVGLPNVGKSTLFMRDGDVVEFRFVPNGRSRQACRYFSKPR